MVVLHLQIFVIEIFLKIYKFTKMHKLTKEFTKLTKFVNYKKNLIDKYRIWRIMKNCNKPKFEYSNN